MPCPASTPAQASRSTSSTNPFCRDTTPRGAIARAVSASRVSPVFTSTITQSAPGGILRAKGIRYEALAAHRHALPQFLPARSPLRVITATRPTFTSRTAKVQPQRPRGADDRQRIAPGHHFLLG